MKSILIKIGLGAILVLLTVAGIFLYRFFHRTEGQYFDVNGTQLYYFEEGNPNGPPVVLIHGFANQADRGWKLTGTVDALQDKYRLILYDTRGCGKSGKPHNNESYGLEMVHDVARLLDHLHIEKAHIGGYSLGGFTSLKFAEMYPERCSTIAVMGAGWENGANSQAMQALDSVAGLLRAGKAIGPLGALIDANRPPPTLLHRFMVNLSTGYLNDPQALAATAQTASQLAVPMEIVQRMNIPVLSVVGEQDVFYPAAIRLRELAPQCSQTIIPNAGHVSAAASPIRSQAIRAFLDEQ